MKKLLSAALIVAAASYLLIELVWFPYHCNRVAHRPLPSARDFEMRHSPRLRSEAERAVRELRSCLERVPGDLNVALVLAVNLELLGRTHDAIAVYEQMLRYDHRPEVYLNLGLARLAIDADQAHRDLARAVQFDPSMLRHIGSPAARYEVYRIVDASRPKGFGLLWNDDFAIAGPSSGVAELSGETGGRSLAAASDWIVWNSTPDPTTVKALPSTRGGGRMLHVRTEGASNGIGRVWGTVGYGPSKVETGVWILVKRGRVSIGSGNAGKTREDVVVDASPEWQYITAENLSCPANQTILFSYGGPAEFSVDEVSVTARPSEPCSAI